VICQNELDTNKLNTHDLSRTLNISRATISRWIAGGCPFQEDPLSRKHLFNLNEVETWLNRKCEQKTSRGSPSRRKLKRYWIFDCGGRCREMVSGSRNAYESLSYFGRDERYKSRSCAVDAAGKEYIAYGGKLRLYNSWRHKDEITWYEFDAEETEAD
jgi:hypothetical protein